jgi:hypothetical protein
MNGTCESKCSHPAPLPTSFFAVRRVLSPGRAFPLFLAAAADPPNRGEG